MFVVNPTRSQITCWGLSVNNNRTMVWISAMLFSLQKYVQWRLFNINSTFTIRLLLIRMLQSPPTHIIKRDLILFSKHRTYFLYFLTDGSVLIYSPWLLPLFSPWTSHLMVKESPSVRERLLMAKDEEREEKSPKHHFVIAGFKPTTSVSSTECSIHQTMAP